eukprot:757588-Hanusia_phi.AAC.3
MVYDKELPVHGAGYVGVERYRLAEHEGQVDVALRREQGDDGMPGALRCLGRSTEPWQVHPVVGGLVVGEQELGIVKGEGEEEQGYARHDEERV